MRITERLSNFVAVRFHNFCKHMFEVANQEQRPPPNFVEEDGHGLGWE